MATFPAGLFVCGLVALAAAAHSGYLSAGLGRLAEADDLAGWLLDLVDRSKALLLGAMGLAFVTWAWASAFWGGSQAVVMVMMFSLAALGLGLVRWRARAALRKPPRTGKRVAPRPGPPPVRYEVALARWSAVSAVLAFGAAVSILASLF